MKIALLGSGNVSTNLGKALIQSGHQITEVWSRTLINAQHLANLLNTKATDSLLSINSESDLYILAVKDEVIENVALEFPFKDKILVHTSGTSKLNLPNISGVFYPLQTFSKQRFVDFKTIPIMVEAKDEDINKLLAKVALSISTIVRNTSSEQRKALHVAAVFACNFSNHLYGIAENILINNALEFDLIKPLIEETAQKIKHLSPLIAQTGPAIRNDQVTITSHIEFLENDPHSKQIYQSLSQSIINLYQKA